ncbi:hypothetical protein OTK49_02760 [Vibrio coralliirubri]|uniref:hypothetical protein n=1 Tax=Vibrio coralliirubri TaxID=1516159 RepID=UPI0022841C22|nr:hypothetical protein [Vibrio coralliirubri]MCY9861439.1 hypothetical protein [Vibrio coralliirubri]
MIISSKIASKFPDHIANCPYCENALPKMLDEYTIDDSITIVTANGYPLFAHNECFRSVEMTKEELDREARLKEYEPHYDLMICNGKMDSSWFKKFDLFKAFDYLMDDQPHDSSYLYGIGRIETEIMTICLSEGTHKDIRCMKEIKRYLDSRQAIADKLRHKLKQRLKEVIDNSSVMRKAVLASKSLKHLGI